MKTSYLEDVRRKNLKRLIKQFGNQAKLAVALGVTSGYITVLKNSDPTKASYRPFNEKTARQLELDLNLEHGWFDQENTDNVLTDVKAQGDSIVIPQYKEAVASMGSGVYVDGPLGEVVNWRVTPEWVKNNVPANTGHKNLRIITGRGDSMKGMFNCGDPLIVDSGVNKIDYDAVYFFRVDDKGFVKRLQSVPGEGIRVISNNPGYPDWYIRENMDFQVFGRVLKVWEGKDL